MPFISPMFTLVRMSRSARLAFFRPSLSASVEAVISMVVCTPIRELRMV